MNLCRTALLATALFATLILGAEDRTATRSWESPVIHFADFQREPNTLMSKIAEDVTEVVAEVRRQAPAAAITIEWVPAKNGDPAGHFRVLGKTPQPPPKTEA